MKKKIIIFSCLNSSYFSNLELVDDSEITGKSNNSDWKIHQKLVLRLAIRIDSKSTLHKHKIFLRPELITMPCWNLTIKY